MIYITFAIGEETERDILGVFVDDEPAAVDRCTRSTASDFILGYEVETWEPSGHEPIAVKQYNCKPGFVFVSTRPDR